MFSSSFRDVIGLGAGEKGSEEEREAVVKWER